MYWQLPTARRFRFASIADNGWRDAKGPLSLVPSLQLKKDCPFLERSFRARLMATMPQLVRKAGYSDGNRSNTHPDEQHRIHTNYNRADASADYSERNEIGEKTVDHALPSID
jgi:hypothetical protein